MHEDTAKLQRRTGTHRMREELLVLDIERLGCRCAQLEEKLPALSPAEGRELAGLYAFLRLHG